MVKDKIIVKKIRIIPFDGKQSSWRMWSYKFLEVEMRKRYKHILVESRISLRRSARLGIGDEDNELKYCYPYKIELNYDENKKFLSIKELKD